MWRRCALFLLAIQAWSAAPVAEVRKHEIWLIHEGRALQLTRDGKTKYQAVLSPTHDAIAYYEGCPQGEHCLPSVVILDLTGQRLRAFPIQVEGGSCSSILGIAWPEPEILAAECHGNPSLSYYVETRIQDGAVLRTFMGYRFNRAPSGAVAHVGWIIHFAPPYVKSEYLMIDDRIVYPLPPGTKPVVPKALEPAPNVVQQRGKVYAGIHQFPGPFVWSADSKQVAFLDCTSDWTVTSVTDGLENGEFSNRRCSAVALSLNGEFRKYPAREESTVSWTNGELQIH